MNETEILLKQIEITPKNLKFDTSVAAYILNPTDGKYPIEKIMEEYLEINIAKYLKSNGVDEENAQITLFDNNEEKLLPWVEEN